MYLNVYVPMPQTGAGTAYFFRKIRGNPVPSSALMEPMTRRFVGALERYSAHSGIDLIRFDRGERKDDARRRTCAGSRTPRGCCTSARRRRRRGCCAPSAATTRCAARTRGWRPRRRWSTITTCTRGRGLRSVVPEVLFVLPVQREAVHQRPRVPQAPVGQGGHCLRGARQRRAELRRPGAHAAVGRRSGDREDRRLAAQVAGAPAAATTAPSEPERSTISTGRASSTGSAPRRCASATPASRPCSPRCSPSGCCPTASATGTCARPWHR